MANLAFDDENRYDWHYIPRMGERKGIPYKFMTVPQSQLGSSADEFGNSAMRACQRRLA